MTNSHQERVLVINYLLQLCHENGWTSETMGIADKIELVAARMGFSRSTVKGLSYSVLVWLKREKEDAGPRLTEEAAVLETNIRPGPDRDPARTNRETRN